MPSSDATKIDFSKQTVSGLSIPPANFQASFTATFGFTTPQQQISNNITFDNNTFFLNVPLGNSIMVGIFDTRISFRTPLLRINDSGGNGIDLSFTADGVAKLTGVGGSPDASLQVGSIKSGANKVLGARGAAVADAAGGAVIDVEARAALNALLARVRATGGHGLIAD